MWARLLALLRRPLFRLPPMPPLPDPLDPHNTL